MNLSDITFIKANCMGKSQQAATIALQGRFLGKTVAWLEQPAGNAKITINGSETKICMKGMHSPN